MIDSPALQTSVLSPAVRSGRLQWTTRPTENGKRNIRRRKNLSVYTTKKDGGRVIRLDEEHKCPFLSENRLCRLV